MTTSSGGGILGAIASVMGNQQDYNQATAGAVGKSQDAGAAMEQMQAEQQGAQKVLDEQKAKADMQVQTVVSNLSQVLGADPTKQNYVKAAWATAFHDETNKALAASQQLEKIDSASFFDNPIAWLPNQFKADSLEQQINTHKDAAGIASQALGKLDALQVSGAEAAAVTATRLTEATQAASLKIAALKGTTEAAKLAQANAATSIQNIHAMATGDERMVSLAKTQFDVQHSQEELALHRAANADAHQSHMADMQYKQEALKHLKFENSVQADKFQFEKDRNAASAVKEAVQKNRLELSTMQLEYNKDKLAFAKEQEPAKREALKAKLALTEATLTKKQYDLSTMEKDHEQKVSLLDKKAASMDLGNIQKEMVIKAKQDEQDAKVQEINLAALGYSALGYPDHADSIMGMHGNTAAWDLRKKSMLDSKEGKDFFDKVIHAGIEAINPGKLTAVSAGVNVADALDTYLVSGRPTSLPQKASDYLTQISAVAQHAVSILPGQQNIERNKLIQKMHPAEREAVIINAVKAQTDLWHSNVEVPGSPLAAPKLGEFSGNKLVTDTPLWQKILAPLVEAGSGNSDYKSITDMAMQAVKAKTISFEDAVKSITTLYR